MQMTKSSLRRLELLEDRVKDRPRIIVMYTDDNDKKITVSMADYYKLCMARKQIYFVRFISGDNLEDFDLFLDLLDCYTAARWEEPELPAKEPRSSKTSNKSRKAEKEEE